MRSDGCIVMSFWMRYQMPRICQHIFMTLCFSVAASTFANAQRASVPAGESVFASVVQPDCYDRELYQKLVDMGASLDSSGPENDKCSHPLLQLVIENQKALLGETYVKENFDSFREVAFTHLGTRREAALVADNMFEQWTYLETYKAMRLRFLLHVLSRTLGFVYHTVPEKLENPLRDFDDLLPEHLFSHYPVLQLERSHMRQQLEQYIQDPTGFESNIATLSAAVESAFMALAVLERKLEYNEATYNVEDERFKQVKVQYTEWKNHIYSSTGLLRTGAFRTLLKKYVEDRQQRKESFAQIFSLQKSAVESFHDEFADFFSARKQSMKGLGALAEVDEGEPLTAALLDEFLQSGHIQELGKSLAAALKLQVNSALRADIDAAMADGFHEMLGNIKAVLNNLETFYQPDVKERVIRANTQSIDTMRTFRTWLNLMFQETPLHVSIVKQFPYLQNAAEFLLRFGQTEIDRRDSQQHLHNVLLGLWVISGPGMKATVANTGLAKGTLFALRSLFFGVAGYLATPQFKGFWNSIGMDVRVRQLNRVNPDGMGLATMIEEETMRASLWNQGFYTAFNVGVIGFMDTNTGRIQ